MLADWLRRRFMAVSIAILALSASIGTTFLVVSSVADQSHRNGLIATCVVRLQMLDLDQRRGLTQEQFNAICPPKLFVAVEEAPDTTSPTTAGPTTSPAATTTTGVVPGRPTARRAPAPSSSRARPGAPTSRPPASTVPPRPRPTTTTRPCVGMTGGRLCVTRPTLP